MSTAVDIYREAFAAGCQRERADEVSEWADRYRILSSVSSSEPGQWRTSRTPYLREPMDCLSSHHPAKRVVFMAGAQVGKTECGNNWIGYVIHSAPGPMLMVLPTTETAKRVSKQRLAPMIEATPALSAIVQEPRVKDSGNTVQMKEFAGGVLIIAGANSSPGLRSMPIRYLFMDEVDEYPADLDNQGDPVMLAEERTATFPRRKVLLTSTPTVRGLSRIEREYMASDQRRFLIPCPACGRLDFLTWGGTNWFERPSDGTLHHWIEYDTGKPETARMVCSSCAERIPENHKTMMLEGGRWEAQNPGPTTVGFHLSGLYSPLGWRSWPELVTKHEAAKGDHGKRKTWVNTGLGEAWEEANTSMEPEALLSRLEDYGGVEVPHGVAILTASVDVQADRLECQVKGWGAGEESWLIAFTQVWGDPAVDPGSSTRERPNPWFELDKFLRRRWEHASGRLLVVQCVTVDARYLTDQVYRFCAPRQHRRVYPVIGSNVRWAPVLSRPSDTNRYGIPLFSVGTDTAKDLIFKRLPLPAPGPGYLHLRHGAADVEYLEQLTAEKCIRGKWVKNKGTVREWVKLRERNEALDLEVYSLAALYILGEAYRGRLPELAEENSKAPTSPPPPQAPPTGEVTLREPDRFPKPRRRRPGGWMGR